jgi:hypothetical protein
MFGVNMAKKASIKKKNVNPVSTLTVPKKPAKKKEVSSSVRSKLKDLAALRSDAKVAWALVGANSSDEEIKKIVSSKNFFKLLGKIS